MDISLRLEQPNDYRIVEELTWEAFWNIYVPGCLEHYLVHQMRTHPDFLADLDYVAELGNKIVGNIMYTRSYLESESGERLQITTFGPISVLPGYQRKGIGSLLIQKTKEIVKEKGYPAIVIMGDPANYVKHGFVSSKKYQIGIEAGKYPSCLLVLAFDEKKLANKGWTYKDSPIYDVNENEVEEFDKTFEKKEKGYQPSQEEFWIFSQSFIQ